MTMFRVGSRLRALMLVAPGLLIIAGGCQQLKQFTAGNKNPASNTPIANTATESFRLARSLEQSGQLAQAAAEYEKIIQSAPLHTPACHRLAVVSDKLGKTTQADKYYQLALANQPENVEVLCDFGYSLYARGELPAAEAQLRKALARAPGHQRANAHLGLVQVRQQRFSEALASFRAAGCNLDAARANVAFDLIKEGKWAEASAQLQVARVEQLVPQPASPVPLDRTAQVKPAPVRVEETISAEVVHAGFSLERLPPIAAATHEVEVEEEGGWGFGGWYRGSE